MKDSIEEIGFIPTNGYFDICGKVVGFFPSVCVTEGETKLGKWKKLVFGLKLNEHSIIFVQILGNCSEEVILYPKKRFNQTLDNPKPIMVQWESRNNHQYIDYRFANELKMSLTPNQEYDTMISWDAIKYIEHRLSNGMQLKVQGRIKLEKYNGIVQQYFNINKIRLLSETEIDQPYQAKFNFKMINAGINEQGNIDARIITKKKNEFIIVPYEFISLNPDIKEYLGSSNHKGKVFYVHGNIIDQVNLVNIEDQFYIDSRIQHLEILGGKLDEENDFVYEIEYLDNFNRDVETDKEDVLGFGEDDDVNEFGF